jgi:hypothetical protein
MMIPALRSSSIRCPSERHRPNLSQRRSSNSPPVVPRRASQTSVNGRGLQGNVEHVFGGALRPLNPDLDAFELLATAGPLALAVGVANISSPDHVLPMCD